MSYHHQRQGGWGKMGFLPAGFLPIVVVVVVAASRDVVVDELVGESSVDETVSQSKDVVTDVKVLVAAGGLRVLVSSELVELDIAV